MPTPNWQAATSGQLPKANQINQFLGTHVTQVIYTGVQKAAQTTAGTGSTNTNGTYLAQSFSTAVGQTAIGYVALNITANTSNSTNLGPTTVSIYTNNAGAPGTSLLSTTVTAEYVNLGPVFIVVPVPLTGLTASTTYWIVIAAAGNASFNYMWNKSNQVSGASTSPNGATWTAQAYGFQYEVFDQSLVNPVVATWEDSGARYVWLGKNTNGTLSNIGEYTSGQTTNGYCQTYRTLSYSSGHLTGVS